jgi:hypothetical protein
MDPHEHRAVAAHLAVINKVLEQSPAWGQGPLPLLWRKLVEEKEQLETTLGRTVEV